MAIQQETTGQMKWNKIKCGEGGVRDEQVHVKFTGNACAWQLSFVSQSVFINVIVSGAD